MATWLDNLLSGMSDEAREELRGRAQEVFGRDPSTNEDVAARQAPEVGLGENVHAQQSAMREWSNRLRVYSGCIPGT